LYRFVAVLRFALSVIRQMVTVTVLNIFLKRNKPAVVVVSTLVYGAQFIHVMFDDWIYVNVIADIKDCEVCEF